MVHEQETRMESTARAAPRPRVAKPNSSAASLETENKTEELSTAKTAPSYVFLRVKRKRNAEPVEMLVVPQAKKQHTGLVDAFTSLSTKEKTFVFKRIDTMDKQYVQETSDGKWTDRIKKKMKSLKEEHPKIKQQQRRQSAAEATQSRVDQQQQRHRERRHSEAQKARGLEMKEQQVTSLPGVHVVDLTTMAAPDTSEPAAATSDSAAAATVTLNGAKLRPTRVLNPGERELDEAIWTAFQHNDFSKFFQIQRSERPEIRGNPVTFQRPADGGTILMAAAMHGRVDVIEPMLGVSSATVLQQDWEGATPAVFAQRHGHSSVHAALLACEESEREKDYVYDVYCMDVSNAPTATSEAAASDDQEIKDAPIVSVSSTVQRWLSQDASLQPKGDDDQVQEYMLESDVENDDADRDSLDSNDEDYFANDYPDEESSGEEGRVWSDGEGDY